MLSHSQIAAYSRAQSAKKKQNPERDMSLNSIGDALKAKSREISPAISEVGIFKHLIRERVHPLDLVRELLSNAGAQQVEATRIGISYTQDKDGHIFEISDNGCGMNYTGDA